MEFFHESRMETGLKALEVNKGNVNFSISLTRRPKRPALYEQEGLIVINNAEPQILYLDCRIALPRDRIASLHHQ